VNNFLYLTNFFIPISLLLTISTRIFCAMPTSEAICGILTDMQGSYVNYCITFYIRVRKTNKNCARIHHYFSNELPCVRCELLKKKIENDWTMFYPGVQFLFSYRFCLFLTTCLCALFERNKSEYLSKLNNEHEWEVNIHPPFTDFRKTNPNWETLNGIWLRIFGTISTSY
jgi:hypothetical protein